MITARRVLLAQAREFVEQHLRGVVSWDQVQQDRPETAPTIGRRRNPMGKFRERAVLRFGPYTLDVRSPDDNPPLGRVALEQDGAVLAEGPLDAAVWAAMGSKIKERCGHGW